MVSNFARRSPRRDPVTEIVEQHILQPAVGPAVWLRTTISDTIQNLKEVALDALPTALVTLISASNVKDFVTKLQMENDRYPSRFLTWHSYKSVIAFVHRLGAVFLYDLRSESMT